MQGGPKVIPEVVAIEDESEAKKQAVEPDSNLVCVSALLVQSVQLMQQALDVAETGTQTILENQNSAPEGLMQKARTLQAVLQKADGKNTGLSQAAFPEAAANNPAMFQQSSQMDAAGKVEAIPIENAAAQKAETAIANATAQAVTPAQVLPRQRMKGTSGIGQADFKDVRHFETQNAAAKTESVGNGSPGEAVKPKDDITAVQAQGDPGRMQALASKAGKEKEKKQEIPVAAAVAGGGMERAVQAEGKETVQDVKPEDANRQENVAVQVARASVHALKRGTTEYRIRLKPEGLGEVEVKVVASGNDVSLSMRTDNETARGLILGHADELRAELNAQNYQISGLSVELGMDGRGSTGFAFGEQMEQMAEQAHALDDKSAPAKTAQEAMAAARQYAARNSTITYRI